MLSLPRIVIAGTHSGAGKTTIATAIMAALAGKGHRVQPFKVGPDYIDPNYHGAATGRVSRNLDAWMMGEETVREMFARSAREAGLSVVEGVMGLYDGLGSTSYGSTAHIARLLQSPVLLVVDVRSMSRSAAALVLGYRQMEPELNLAGVILNRVGSRRHFNLIKEAIEDTCRVPVVGFVPREAGLTLPERHLGLLPAFEKSGLERHIAALAQTVQQGIDVEAVAGLAASAPAFTEVKNPLMPVQPSGSTVRLGVCYDRAFNFYYRDGLDLLAALGAEPVFVSPLADACLPQKLDGLYIGGGFPEMFLESLAQNEGFREDLRRAAASGLPVYAECGGLMYLTGAIADFTGREYPAAGVLPGCCRMEKKRAALGYVRGEVLHDSILASRGKLLHGHEFHYSTWQEAGQCMPAYRLTKTGGESGREDGLVRENILASYLHLHFAGCPEAAANLVEACRRYRRGA